MTSFYLRAAALLGGSSSTPLNVGEQTILPTIDNGNANLLVAQVISLPSAGTLSSLSFYVGTAAGNLRLGLYADDGTGTKPGALLAQTASFVPVAGWNTVAVTTATLAAGTYWLAYLPSSNTLAFRNTGGTTPQSRFYTFTFGSMPATFSASPSSTPSHWSFYATFLIGASAPVVNNGNFSMSVPATSGQVVGTMTASGSPTSWAITAGNASGFFAISNLGLITVTAAGASGLVAGSYSLTCSATNAAGSGGGTAAITASVVTQGTLPPGVTLQAIDGETMLNATTMSMNYYGRSGFTRVTNTAFNKSWDDPTFFPILTFYSELDATANGAPKMLDLGYNCAVASFSGPTWSVLDTYKFWYFNNDAADAPSPSADYICGTYSDEPRNQTTNVEGSALYLGVAPGTSIAGGPIFMNQTSHSLANNAFGSDGSGPDMTNFIYPNKFWTTPNPGSQQRGVDIGGIDVYFYAGSTATAFRKNDAYSMIYHAFGGALTTDQMARGSNYGNMIDMMRVQWTPAGAVNKPCTVPLSLFVENSAANDSANGSRQITPAEMWCAAWSTILHGARMLCWFYYSDIAQLSPGNAYYDATKQIDNLIQTLAPVINAPFAVNYVAVTMSDGNLNSYVFPNWNSNPAAGWFGGGIDCSAKYYSGPTSGILVNGKFYIIATTRYGESGYTSKTATFNVNNPAASQVTVINENRILPLSDVGGGHKTFTDAFATPQTVHIYRVD